MYKKYFKRILDIIISLLFMPFLGVISLFVIPMIKLEDGGPIFYISQRVGIDKLGFNMYKFRSMKVNSPDLRTADNETYNAEDDPRLTRIGKILRKTSIDETPQFINVLKGDMSIIGPRPNLFDKRPEDLPAIEVKRLEVRPGITGYNQAYFRNSLSKQEKFEKDVYYVDNVSFKLDIQIFFKTLKTVIFRDNIYNS